MGCDHKFHTFFQFHHHWKNIWITIFIFICLLLSFVQVESPIQLLLNKWSFLLQTLKKYTIFHTYHDIARFLLSVFELATIKLLMSAMTANRSQYVSWYVIVSNYIEYLNGYILTKMIYMDNGQWELCPRFLRIWGLPCQRPNNAKLLPI